MNDRAKKRIQALNYLMTAYDNPPHRSERVRGTSISKANRAAYDKLMQALDAFIEKHNLTPDR
jgi:hypothetical protein